MPTPASPRWLWQISRWGFSLLFLGIVGLTLMLAQGWADPPRAGAWQWREDFKHGAAGWEFYEQGGRYNLSAGALAMQFDLAGSDHWVAALTAPPAADFTLEIAGAQAEGEIGLAYGVVFGWQDETHYQAVLINGNGYAGAYTQAGADRREWYAWQQWPNILVGAEANRVRVDVRGQQVIARINDEWLAETQTDAAGRIGLMAYGHTAGRVVFGWAQLWSK